MTKRFRWYSKMAVVLPLFSMITTIFYLYILEKQTTVSLEYYMIIIASWLVAGIFPLIFVIYREKLIDDYMQKLQHLDNVNIASMLGLNWNRYAIPISLLVVIIIGTAGGLVCWDLSIRKGIGKGWAYLSYGIIVPTSVVEWGFIGAMVFIFQDMMSRFSSRDLTPRFYFLSFVRIIVSGTASVLIFTLVQAVSPLYKIEVVNSIPLLFKEEILTPINAKTVYWLIPLCFTAGLFPAKTIGHISRSVFKWLSHISSPSFIQTEDYSTNISRIDGINGTIESRLFEEGVYTVQNLAMSDLAELAEKTPFNIATLLDWQDQAMLLCSIGKSNLGSGSDQETSVSDVLQKNGLFRFSDLYYLAQLEGNCSEITTIEKNLSHPFLLSLLRSKGLRITRYMEENNVSDVRIAAFEVWNLSRQELRQLVAGQLMEIEDKVKIEDKAKIIPEERQEN